MRVLVCGGRDFSDRALFAKTMNEFVSRNRVVRIIQGGARGADALARDWCQRWGYTYEHFPADWAKYGKAAGPIRNQQMIDEGKPDLVIAFPGGKGTADMIRRAEIAGMKVIRVQESDQKYKEGSA